MCPKTAWCSEMSKSSTAAGGWQARSCTKLLAGLGAEVVLVECPGPGDPERQTSASFQYLNTSKKSITLSLESAQGVEIFGRLARDSDVLVESFPPGYMDPRGLGYSSLGTLNPGLVYTSITPFGQTGPYRDYKGSDLVAQAMGCLEHTIGQPEREPLKIGGNAGLYAIGLSAFSAIMLALYVRDTQGYGQHVDISAMEAMAVTQIHASIHHQFGRVPVRREGTLVQAKDGWVNPGLEVGVQEDIWQRVCDLMGVPSWRMIPLSTPGRRAGSTSRRCWLSSVSGRLISPKRRSTTPCRGFAP